MKTSGGNKATTQGNGELAAEVTASNGYTCHDCRMLSARTDALTAHSATHGTTSRVYSRDRSLKQRKSPASVVSKRVCPALPVLINLTMGLRFHPQHRPWSLTLFPLQS